MHDGSFTRDVAPPPEPLEVVKVASALDTMSRALGAQDGGIATLEQMSARYARGVVLLCNGNKASAARALGISRTRLYRMLRREER